MKPTGALKDELLDELLLKERTIEKMKAKLKDDSKLMRDRITAQEQRRSELVDLLEGKTHQQPSLPLLSPGKDGKKPAPAELVWAVEAQNDVAQVPGGIYCVEPQGGARAFGVYWTPEKGKSKKLGEEYARGAAKELARKDWVERAANAILENAGDGKLTGKIRGIEKVK